MTCLAVSCHYYAKSGQLQIIFLKGFCADADHILRLCGRSRPFFSFTGCFSVSNRNAIDTKPVTIFFVSFVPLCTGWSNKCEAEKLPKLEKRFLARTKNPSSVQYEWKAICRFDPIRGRDTLGHLAIPSLSPVATHGWPLRGGSHSLNSIGLVLKSFLLFTAHFQIKTGVSCRNKNLYPVRRFAGIALACARFFLWKNGWNHWGLPCRS